MSFSSKVKSEIATLEIKKPQNIYAQAYGLLIFGARIKEKFLTVSYENENVVEKLYLLLNILSDLGNFEKNYHLTKKGFHSIKIDLSSKFCINPELIINPNISNISKDCIADFLAGAFLSCGSVMDPETDYHLEFNIPSPNLCKLLLYAISQVETIKLCPKNLERKSGFSIYIKGSEKIEDFLVLMGAKACAMEFMQTKMLKEVRNNINRNINFETANLSKITSSSSNHIKAIKKIINSNSFSSLPPLLRETANLRTAHPYASLNELSLLHNKKVSKSGVNHRLKKLIKLAQRL